MPRSYMSIIPKHGFYKSTILLYVCVSNFHCQEKVTKNEVPKIIFGEKEKLSYDKNFLN